MVSPTGQHRPLRDISWRKSDASTTTYTATLSTTSDLSRSHTRVSHSSYLTRTDAGDESLEEMSGVDESSQLLRTAASPSFFRIFRFINFWDGLSLAVGLFIAIISSVALPGATWVFYEFFLEYQVFLDNHPSRSAIVTGSGIGGDVWTWVLVLGGISIATLLLGFIQAFLIERTAERQIKVSLYPLGIITKAINPPPYLRH
jgi:hypothetical protein